MTHASIIFKGVSRHGGSAQPAKLSAGNLIYIQDVQDAANSILESGINSSLLNAQSLYALQE